MKARYVTRKFLKHRNKASHRPAWRFPLIIELEIGKWILPSCLLQTYIPLTTTALAWGMS
jgi:hypothetical protein